MSSRGRRGRGRPPKSSFSGPGRSFLLKKPKFYTNESDSNSNSRCSTPVGSNPNTPSSRVSTRSGGRGRIHEWPRKSVFLNDARDDDDFGYNEDENSDVDGENDDLDDPLDDRESDFSFEEDESVYSEESYGSRKKGIFQRRPKSPEIMDEETVPPLPMPASSTDLNFDHDLIMQALGLYEVLRHYRVILRLSPFRFEDFLQALRSEEHSCLLTEIHITLLRALQREEESNNTTFGPQDVKDSINITFYFLDALSWPEVAYTYLDSAVTQEFRSALPALNKPDYYSTSISERLQILQTLTDLFLATSTVREEIMNEGNIRYDDHCRACHK